MRDEAWIKADLPMNLWAWPWMFWSEAAAQWMRAWTGLWAGGAPQWLPINPVAEMGVLTMAWWPTVDATITPLRSHDGRETAVRLSMRVRLPGEDPVAVEAVMAREKDMGRLLPEVPEALPDRRRNRSDG